MAEILHRSARTTPRVRAELKASEERTGRLAHRYRLSRTTVAKWRSRTMTAGLRWDLALRSALYASRVS